MCPRDRVRLLPEVTCARSTRTSASHLGRCFTPLSSCVSRGQDGLRYGIHHKEVTDWPCAPGGAGEDITRLSGSVNLLFELLAVVHHLRR